MNKQKFLMATPAITREHTPGSCRNSRKDHETCRSLRDGDRFPCIACREIPCSQSNRKGALICLLELQKVPEKSLRSLEEH